MLFLSKICKHWHYKTWQRYTAGYLRTFIKNRLPNNELIGYVINDKHPKSIRVACDRYSYLNVNCYRYMYVVRYKKTFRMTKKVWAHDEYKEARLGDIVRIQPLGYRIGPWKTYVLTRILHTQNPHLDNF
uniref:Ribosomal protein S17, putative n=1 Tax=Theileria annulata TaxID=5874 RepID=A0A3B0NIQ4_THEAN